MRWLYGLVPLALTIVVRYLLDPVLEDKSPFLLFILAVMLAAAYGGFWVGATATLIGGIAGLLFLSDTAGGPWGIARSGRWLQPLLYLVVCAGVTYQIELLHRLRHRAETATAGQVRVAEELRAADRAKDEFLATLSHELRTPLNAIYGWTHVLMARSSGEEVELRRAVEAIQRSAEVQNQLISDLLDVARITAGKMRLEARPVDPAASLLAAVETLRPAAGAKRVEVDVVAEPGTTVFADANRLQQVFWNLISNAVKFTPASSRVSVRLSSRDDRVQVSVADQGAGVRPEFLPYVFERFRQDDGSPGSPRRGLGLGLAIVRQLVELHGGTVAAANRPDGPGAKFEVTLPRVSDS